MIAKTVTSHELAHLGALLVRGVVQPATVLWRVLVAEWLRHRPDPRAVLHAAHVTGFRSIDEICLFVSMMDG